MATDRFTSLDYTPGVSEQDVLDAVRGVRDEMRRAVEAAKAELSLAVAGIVKGQIHAALRDVRKELKTETDSLRREHKDASQSLERVIKAMPRPEVNVSVPKQDVPKIEVNVPQGKPAEVTVNVPQQKAPEVTVNVPKQEQRPARQSA